MPKGFRPCFWPAAQTASKTAAVSATLVWISQPSSPAKETRTSWHQRPAIWRTDASARAARGRHRYTSARIFARIRAGEDLAGEVLGDVFQRECRHCRADASSATRNRATAPTAAVIRKKKSSSSAMIDISVTMRPLVVGEIAEADAAGLRHEAGDHARQASRARPGPRGGSARSRAGRECRRRRARRGIPRARASPMGPTRAKVWVASSEVSSPGLAYQVARSQPL